MNWFNYYGLVIIFIIMVPNTIYAIKCKDKFTNIYDNKTVLFLEQVGRYGCMVFMVFNLPYTLFGLWFDNAIVVYIIANAFLCALYLIFWLLKSKMNNIASSLALSIIPSLIFVTSGIIIASIPLLVASIVFAFAHIMISFKNAKATK